MNDKQKIELADFISDKHFTLYARWGNARIPDSDNIEFTNVVLQKIADIHADEVKRNNDRFLSDFELAMLKERDE